LAPAVAFDQVAVLLRRGEDHDRGRTPLNTNRPMSSIALRAE
jgi:hypothetical protein